MDCSKSMLVLGGAASGKSAYAESVVRNSGLVEHHYVATAYRDERDAEMAYKISVHQQRREEQGGWQVHEADADLCGLLRKIDTPQRIILVDCLTLWLGQLALGGELKYINKLCETVNVLDANIVFVSNELGLGLVPDTSIGRTFREQHGLMNQAIAHSVERVVFVAAGLPLVLK